MAQKLSTRSFTTVTWTRAPLVSRTSRVRGGSSTSSTNGSSA